MAPEELSQFQTLPPLRKKKILVVDDSEDIHTLIQYYFSGKQFVLESALNGKEGLKKLETFSPDLLILDILMPVMDGMAMLSELRNNPRYRQLPVVVLTAKRVTPEEEWRFKKGVSAVVSKGEQFEADLKRVVRQMLRTRHT
ncbi:MAG: response regulator [Acidobacteria bacterium]|nr:response regulator [Acidobacteriota bacterium]